MLFVVLFVNTYYSSAQTDEEIAELNAMPVAFGIEFVDWKLHLMEGYEIDGELEIDTLKFLSVNTHDLVEYIFQDEKNESYGFIINNTRWEFTTDSEEQSQTNIDLVNKKFIIVWRNLKFNTKAVGDYHDFPSETKEILYLKEIKQD